MRRIIIAGSRDFTDYQSARNNSLSVIKNDKEIEIVSGGCRGVDKLAEKFAKEMDFKFKEFPADWSLGKRAGYIRNKQMAEYAAEENGLLIAFLDFKSRGTKMMINLARQNGLEIFIFDTRNLQ